MPDIYKLSSYAYQLPDRLIAQHPLVKRDDARLMVINRKDQSITHDIFSNLGKYLPQKSTLVLNNSKVIPARLLGRRKSGGEVEVFILKALGDGVSFEALLKPLKRIKDDEVIELGGGIEITLIDRERRVVRFNKPDAIEILKEIGHIPLPPYIKREDTQADKEDYQTVYAKDLGSVAAPTAGLHFSEELIVALKTQGHHFSELTLHINYGTFKPVECDDIRQHPMHSEVYDALSLRGLNGRSNLNDKKQSIIAVGTTSCRVLESLAKTGQWQGETNIFIYPGFSFKMVDHLITNFHLPYSTLLMLACAFGGYELVMRAYNEAIKEQYRFYSYGDAMLIL